MPRLRVHCFSISLDGYGAGPDQSLDNPLGVGGMALHEWVFATRTFQQMFGQDGGTTGIDDDFAARGFDNIGAWILGRNMFGPVRGALAGRRAGRAGGATTRRTTAPSSCSRTIRAHSLDDGGRHHLPLRHRRHPRRAGARHARPPNGKDIRLGGGVATIRQYLQAGLVDEMHLAISPVLLGSGEHLLAGIDLPKLGYRCTEHVRHAGRHACRPEASSRIALLARPNHEPRAPCHSRSTTIRCRRSAESADRALRERHAIQAAHRRPVDQAPQRRSDAVADRQVSGAARSRHRDRTVPETSVIIEYLEQHYPGPHAADPGGRRPSARRCASATASSTTT